MKIEEQLPSKRDDKDMTNILKTLKENDSYRWIDRENFLRESIIELENINLEYKAWKRKLGRESLEDRA